MKNSRFLTRSPDLSPIENVWGLIKQKLNNMDTPKSLNELRDIIQNIWSNFDKSIIINLYSSISSCLLNVRAMHGRMTKY